MSTRISVGAKRAIMRFSSARLAPRLRAPAPRHGQHQGQHLLHDFIMHGVPPDGPVTNLANFNSFPGSSRIAVAARHRRDSGRVSMEATWTEYVTTPKIRPASRNSNSQLRKEQKLEMMGALAGFIAHDLNNELTVILGNVGLSLDALEPRSSALRRPGRSAARLPPLRGHDARAAQPRPEREAGAETGRARSSCSKAPSASCAKSCPPAVPTKFAKHTHLPAIMADATQIQQVIMNLAANASRAMPEESLLEVQAKNGPKIRHHRISVSSVGGLQENTKRLYVPLSPSKANREASHVRSGPGHRNRARARRLDRHGARSQLRSRFASRCRH